MAVGSPWELETWRNRCRPSCHALAPLNTPPHTLISLSLLPPTPPCGATRLFRGSVGTLLCMAYGLFNCAALNGQTFCLFVPPPHQEKPRISSHPPPLHDASYFDSKGGDLVFPAGVSEKDRKCCCFQAVCCCMASL